MVFSATSSRILTCLLSSGVRHRSTRLRLVRLQQRSALSSLSQLTVGVGKDDNIATNTSSSMVALIRLLDHFHGRCYSSSTISSSGAADYNSHNQLPPDDPQTQFKPTPPTSLNLDMVQKIQSANNLILKYGVGRQRLELLAKKDSDDLYQNMSLVLKWQRMMEIYLGAQLHVIASLGYDTNETGIMAYTQQLGQFISTQCTHDQQEDFRKVGRDTWREMLAIAFDLNKDDIRDKYITSANDEGYELSIVDARNIVHKVASKLVEPHILEEVAIRVGQIPPQSDKRIELGIKHSIIQDIVVNQVYLDGDPKPLVEELGFGSGPKGYATMQYIMAYHENDPLCQQYTSSSMAKIWQAAGLNLNTEQVKAMPGGKLPMSSP